MEALMKISGKRTRILMVATRVILGEALRCLIEREPDLKVTHTGYDSTQILGKIKARKGNWDVVLLILFRPDGGTSNRVKEIKRIQPDLRVLVLNFDRDDHYGVRLLRAGADGYLTADSKPGDLLEAIRKIVLGGTYIHPALTAQLAIQLKGGLLQSLHSTLTDREYEVLRLIAVGRSRSEIAQTLSLRPRTVHTHRARILEKMNMKNDVELARYALKEGLAD